MALKTDYTKTTSVKFHPTEVLDRLKKFKDSGRSWDRVSEDLELPRRSLIRWIRTGKMNYSSLRLLSMALHFKGLTPNIKLTEELHSKDKKHEML